MAHHRPPSHTHEDGPDLPLPHEPRPKKMAGKGGTRHGYVSGNEIEDMTLFDEDPGKAPSKEKPPKSKTH